MTDADTGNGRRFAADEGRVFATGALVAAGLSRADAAEVAALTILADLRGTESHGIMRLPIYVQRLRAGTTNKSPEIRIIEERNATALIDGDNGMGHLVMSFAARLAIDKAAKSGIGWVGARMSNHAGAAAAYPMMMLERNMIGLYFAVADVNHMAPWGGVEPMLGTNPIAIAVPTQDEPPIVLDIATTVASNGKVAMAAQNNWPLEPGWAIDREGKPLTDAKHAEEGSLLPIGGYKGYGLSLVVALLGGVLNGTPVGRDAGPGRNPANTGQAIMALDIASFGPPESFKRQTDKLARDLRGSKPIPGMGEVRYPGLQGHRNAVERGKSGIPIRSGVIAALEKLAASLEIAPLKLL